MKKYLKTIITMFVWLVIGFVSINSNAKAETDNSKEIIMNGNVVSVSEDGFALVDYKGMNIFTKSDMSVRIFPYAQDKVIVDVLDNCIGTGFADIEPSQYFTKVGSLIPIEDCWMDSNVETFYTDMDNGYVFYVNPKGYMCAQKCANYELSDTNRNYYNPIKDIAYICD